MKIKIFLISFLSLFTILLNAQNEQVTTYILNWKPVEKWLLDSTFIKVVSFETAQYPNDNHLPYFTQRLVCDAAFSYNAILKNTEYIPVTDDENTLLKNSTFPTDPELIKNILHSRGTSYFEVHLLPFVVRNGVIMKLKSFDLQINKTSNPQKVYSTTIHTYASNSVLASGKFVKIRITNSGIYKLTYEDLVSMGVDPANVKIFGYGGNVLDQSFLTSKVDDLPELPIYMNKGNDGVFNAGDYILFYAQGINKWTFDNIRSIFTHTINPYSKYGFYFVTSDIGAGRKISNETISIPQTPTIKTVEEFTDYQVHELESISIASTGREFYGETFNDIISYNLPFSFPNPVLTKPLVTKLNVVASANANSSFTLSLDGTQSQYISVAQRYNDNFTMGMESTGFFSYTPTSGSMNFNITYNKPTSTSIGYLNYLEVNARRQLKMVGSAMQFQNIDYLGQSVFNQYLLSDANSNVQVWDITDPQNTSSITTQPVNGKLSFIDSGTYLKNYIAIDPSAASSFAKPEIIGTVPNQNLHSISQSDMVIITNPAFLSQANTLAQAHADKDNLKVSVVTTDQVYNEFSSGTPDATAYRWMLKMLYDRALSSNGSLNLPKYLLLFGRGTYDNRGIVPNSGDNLILTYQAENSLVTTTSYVTDDYFGLLDDGDGTYVSGNLLDVGIGRFPVATTQQATDVVKKTIDYINNKNKGHWKNQLCFLADDGDAALHMRQADSIAVSVNRNFPGYQITKIYLDAYLQEISASGQSYPVAKAELLNLIQSGLFLLDFTGHAGPTGLTNESVLSLSDVKKLTNSNLPLFVGATCDFLQFDGQIVSGGEGLLLNPFGGSIGVFSSARPVYATENFDLNKLVCDNLFKKINGNSPRIGDVILYAKNNVGNQTNKLSYIYMGDPAIRLNYPTNYQLITNKVNESSSSGKDTLRALSIDTIQGFVADNYGNKVTSFNGNLHATVYDKVQQFTTLNNEGDGTLTYNDRQNTLFSGNAVVKDGTFSFSFMLPKDIRYNYGGGRVNYYAQDDVNNFEAQGFFENFIVGGTNKVYNNETDGPDIKLFLNSDNFVSGDKVNETPVLIAKVSDIDGINTVGSGIGHNITVTVDNDPSQSFILNDYFEAALNSYTDGTITYKLPLMQDGKHTLLLKVWDLLNNSSTASVDFEVVTGLTPQIFTIYNYPNPVKTKTNIVVKHDRPETILSTTVEIFDLSGRKIWSFTQSSADQISWDLNSNEGQRVKTGIYLYRVSIKTSDSDVTSKTNKMLVVQ